jgi:hypothetical protein
MTIREFSKRLARLDEECKRCMTTVEMNGQELNTEDAAEKYFKHWASEGKRRSGEVFRDGTLADEMKKANRHYKSVKRITR